MKKLLLLIICLITGSLLTAQNLSWYKQFYNHGMSSFQNVSVSTNSNGEIVNSGLFQPTSATTQFIDFDPSASTYSVTASPSIYSMWVSKLDATGNFLWATKFNANNNGSGVTISKINTLGEVIVGARFLNSTDFDSGVGTYSMSTWVGGSANGFFAKLDANGNFAWAKQFQQMSGSSQALISDIELDNLNNSYISGSFVGTIDFDASPTASVIVNGTSASSMFFAKYDNAGNFVWVKTFNGPLIGGSKPVAIVLDNNKNILTTGTFNGQVDFDPSASTYTLSSILYSPYNEGFAMKLDSNGQFIWAKQFADPKAFHNNGTPVSDIAIDTNDDVYITGSTKDSLDFDPGVGTYYLKAAGSSGYEDVFAVKLSSTGNFVWAKMFHGNYSDFATSIKLDNNNDVYIGINFQSYGSTIDLDPNVGTFTITGTANPSMVVNKLNFNGNYISSYYFNSNSNSPNYINSMAFDTSNELLVSGDFLLDYFNGSKWVDFDPGVAVVKGINTFGYTDGFVVKLNNLSTGIKETAQLKSFFTLYPNPNNGSFYINLEQIEKPKLLEIYNLLGEKVYEQCIIEQHMHLNLNLKTGIYFVNIIDNLGNKVTKKISVE